MKYSPTIESYLSQNRIKVENTLFLVTDYWGSVLDGGTIKRFLQVPVEIGEPAELHLPVLRGLFPLEQNLYLPTTQLTHDVCFDIHVVNDLELNWVIAHERSIEVPVHLFNYEKNIGKLQSELKILNGMEYYVFRKNETGRCFAITSPPKWVNRLINRNIEIEHPCAVTIFPILEGFVSLLPPYEPGEKMVKKYAGVWHQSATDGTEMTLQAWALQCKDEAYLVVGEANKYECGKTTTKQDLESSLVYKQLEQTRVKLQSMVKLKEQFVKLVSYDNRSPVSTLIDGISFLQDVFEGSGKAEPSELAIINQVKDELSRLLEYNNKLYNWTQLNFDTLELNREKVPLRMVINGAKEHLGAKLAEKKIGLQLEISDRAVINSDYVLISQTVTHLLDNAIKYSYNEGKILIEASSVCLKVQDEGVGMDEEVIDELQNGNLPQSRRGTNGEKGYGLGLSIVYKIVQILNFSIEIQSEKGRGTTFLITFSK
jgi:signal transduction histidine kinase